MEIDNIALETIWGAKDKRSPEGVKGGGQEALREDGTVLKTRTHCEWQRSKIRRNYNLHEGWGQSEVERYLLGHPRNLRVRRSVWLGQVCPQGG